VSLKTMRGANAPLPSALPALRAQHRLWMMAAVSADADNDARQWRILSEV